MIRVHQLQKSFGSQTLFSEVSFSVHQGEKVGIVGRNGYGKSTLLRMISGKESIENGEIFLPKDYRIGTLDQHISFSEGTILKEACLGLRKEEKEKIWQAEMILSGLGFSEKDFQRDPHEFSGGFQIRINLAKALLANPDLLLLDEPTNYLDILSLRWLSRFLQKWKGEFLLVTHNRAFMDEVTTHTMIIHRQKIRKVRGKVSDAYQQIGTEENVSERTRVAAEKKKAKSEEFIRKFRSGARSAGLVQSRIKMLNKLKPQDELEKISSIRFRFHEKECHSGNMMMVNSLCFGYKSGNHLIEKLNFTLGSGDRIAIIGRNGAGKSTLLKLLAEELSPLSGSIKQKTDIHREYFVQSNTLSLAPQKSILEELYDTEKKVNEQEIRSLCASLLFRGNDVHKKISVLSGGEKSRVSLGKMMLAPTHMLLLDEPSNHLDMESCDALCDALLEFSGGTIFISHDENILRRLANKLIVFDGGKAQVYEMGYDTFLEEIGWQEEEEKGGIVMKKKNKDDRQQKKEWQKHLRKSERRAVEIEKELEVWEGENEENTKKLQGASQENDHIKMREYGEKATELIEGINARYQELEEILKKQEELLLQLRDA